MTMQKVHKDPVRRRGARGTEEWGALQVRTAAVRRGLDVKSIFFPLRQVVGAAKSHFSQNQSFTCLLIRWLIELIHKSVRRREKQSTKIEKVIKRILSLIVPGSVCYEVFVHQRTLQQNQVKSSSRGPTSRWGGVVKVFVWGRTRKKRVEEEQKSPTKSKGQ